MSNFKAFKYAKLHLNRESKGIILVPNKLSPINEGGDRRIKLHYKRFKSLAEATLLNNLVISLRENIEFNYSIIKLNNMNFTHIPH